MPLRKVVSPALPSGHNMVLPAWGLALEAAFASRCDARLFACGFGVLPLRCVTG